MRILLFISLLFISQNWYSQKKYVLVIHGGAGTITPEMMTPEKEKEYKTKLTEALEAGYQKINDGKTSLEAIESAIIAIHMIESAVNDACNIVLFAISIVYVFLLS